MPGRSQLPGVSGTDDRQSGRAAMVEALRVRRNAVRGFAAGIVFTAAVFLVFVVFPPGTAQSTVYYVGLAIVLALTTGGLATIVLVALEARRLAKST